MVRAKAIPAAERRAAIIAATERLIIERGGAVNTRAIAEAAGIAEGTIFRVFPTKDAIIDAIFADAFDVDAYGREIKAIGRRGDLRTRLILAIEILQRRIRRVMALFAAIGFRKPANFDPRSGLGGQRRFGFEEIAVMLAPDVKQLRVSPTTAARMVLSMVMTLSMFGGASPNVDAALTPDEVADLILNGVGKIKDV